MKRVLVCEDESAIREFVVINLRRQGYDVLEAPDGEKALDLFRSAVPPVDVALLDVMLPGMDGFAVCRAMREQSRDVGIIMLTARGQESDKVNGFSMGADDYVTKPFGPSELMARVDALFRRLSRPKSEASRTLASGRYVLDPGTHTLRIGEKTLDLTQVEYQIMEYFFQNPGKVLGREDILVRVWGEDHYGEIKTVDVNIRRLRMKVEEDPSTPRHILTVWGMGYKWMA